MIKGPIHQEGITIVNVYEPQNRTVKYTKQILIDLKRINKHQYNIVWLQYPTFNNTQLSTMHKSPKKKINKGTLDLKYALDQMAQNRHI